MIQNKADLKEYLAKDMPFYQAYNTKDRKLLFLTKDPAYEIKRYIRLLRYEEYYFNCRQDILGKVCYLLYFRSKNVLGNKLGFKIPRNTFEEGLSIYHHGFIIVNESARIGKNAQLHGDNCIGNKGKTDNNPVVGDNLILGVGAKIIGGVKLGNQITVGANAVVTNSFEDSNITLVGVPAKPL